jgi:2'-hydroxyisoflavone reductase
MRALVLGGSTFVGRRLAEWLHGEGHDTTVLNRGRTETALDPAIARLVADRTDPEQLRAALDGREWDAVFDVSGFVMVAGQADVTPLLDLLDGHVGRYVFVSSIMAYEPTGWFPWTEDAPVRPDPPTTYGGFKVHVERAVLERHARTGFPGCAVRPAAIYGPYNNIYDMEAAMFLRLRQHRPVLLPHEGLVTGSYGHVDDLVEAMGVLAVHPGAVGEIVNVTGQSLTTAQYVAEVAAVVGTDADVRLVPRAVVASLAKPAWGHLFSVAHHGVLSTAKAEALGIRPRWGFRDGHAHTYEWFCASGLADAGSPLADPVWRASYDFDHEAAVAASL